MAYVNRRVPRGLILRSDRGSQHASADVRAWLALCGLQQSMSGTGNCYGNAPMESFWHSLKVEETHEQNFTTRAAAKHCVFAYIEGDRCAPKEVHLGDNTTHMHSSLGYKSSAQLERDCVAHTPAANDEQIIQHGYAAQLHKRAA